MTASTIRQLLADLLAESNFEWQMGEGRLAEGEELAVWQADALLTSPLKDIIDLAAMQAHWEDSEWEETAINSEVRALLADWRASCAEQKPAS